MKAKTETTTIACLTSEPLVDGRTVRTLCGQHLQVHISLSHDATESGDYIVCPLCELAWFCETEMHYPTATQGELF
jgi:hypothetical protein